MNHAAFHVAWSSFILPEIRPVIVHLSLSFSFISHLAYDSKLFSALIIDLGGYILCGHIIWWYESHVTIRKRCFASNSHKTWRRIYRCQGCSHPINWSGWMLSRKLHWMNTLWLHAWHPVSTRDQVCMHVWPRQPALNFDVHVQTCLAML